MLERLIMNKCLKILEFDKIIEQVKIFCLSSLGEKLVDEMTPFDSYENIIQKQDETEQARYCFDVVAKDPFDRIDDVDMILKKISMGGLIQGNDALSLLSITRATDTTKNYMLSKPTFKDKAKKLFLWSSALENLQDCEDFIQNVFRNDGHVKDNASKCLKSIREEYQDKQNEIKNKVNQILESNMQRYMQENIVTLRNERYVFPIKATYKSHIEGILHDQSASGNTVYIEPLILVRLQNELFQIKQEEQVEIEKILRKLSEELLPYVENFKKNSTVLAKFDFAFAKAKFASKCECTRPEFVNKQLVSLLQARHPLIDKKSVVSNDLKIKDRYKSLIITGPNTGGKTVILKTMGLLVIMHQAGLQIPVSDGSVIGYFKTIFADIGDEQSIEQSLSTFSSHIVNIRKILEKIDNYSLILFDELGSGTDPSEGVSLAIAILKYCLEKGSIVLATTHYNELKTFAYQTKSVCNASVDFDAKSLKPTYRLIYGVAGQSNAFVIAQHIGLNNIIIEEAKKIYSQQSSDVNIFLNAIEDEKLQLDRDKELFNFYKEAFEEEKKSFEQEKQKFIYERQKIKKTYQKEMQSVIDTAKKEMEEAIVQIKALQKDNNFTAIVKGQSIKSTALKKAEGLKSNETDEYISFESIPQEDIFEGMEVYVRSLDDNGIIVNYTKGNKKANVEIGALKIALEIKELFYPKNKKRNIVSKQKNFSNKKSLTVKKTLDLRGSSIEDALLILDKYVDDAYLSSIYEATIIHGKGTGALRKAISEYLKTNKRISSFRLGENSEGGNGVTIITIK